MITIIIDFILEELGECADTNLLLGIEPDGWQCLTGTLEDNIWRLLTNTRALFPHSAYLRGSLTLGP